LVHLTRGVLEKRARFRFPQVYCNNQSMGKAAGQTLHRQLFQEKLFCVEIKENSLILTFKRARIFF